MPASRPAGTNSKTIAVLPFTNLSERKEDEYFSNGMTEDVLAQLVKIADLRVISRTTMMQYKGAKKSLKEIGKELNARVILEGSVRRAGDQIRIVAQLIDATNDQHLWAETYDREFKQIFSIQSEIAQKIASSLQATLSPTEKERLAKPATVNTEAYTAYLQGRYFYDRRSKEDLEKAIGYFEQALQINPKYARAWVGLSETHSAQANYGYIPVGKGHQKARLEAEKALELDPNLADAHSQMGWIKRRYDWDWSGADESYQRALELDPGNAGVIRGAAGLARTLGRFDEAITLMRRSVELDPVSANLYLNLGLYAWYAGLLNESQTAYGKCLELNPQFPDVHSFIGLVFLEKGKPDSALAEIMRETETDWQLYGLALVYHALGKKKESDTALAELIRGYQDGDAYQIAEIYAYRGETDKAFEWLERAYNQRDGGLPSMKGNPLLRNIKKDPRYAEFMKKMKLPL
jgi:TolB-like protein/lipoprotein NlpI